MSEGHKLKESTLDSYQKNLDLYITPYFKDFLLKKITRKEVLAFRSSLLVGQRLHPRTAKNIFKNFRAILKYALQEELINVDCSQGISIVVPKRVKNYIITTEEIQKLWNCEWTDNRVRLATLLAASTGARRGEIIALRWKDLNLENSKVHISGSWYSKYKRTTTKNGEERDTFMAPELCEEFKLYRQLSPCGGSEDLVFPSTIEGNRPIDVKRLDKVFHQALVNIGISEEERRTRKLTFHNLRHRLITVLHQNRISPLTVRAMVGHADDEIEYEYYHGNGEEVVSILSAVFNSGHLSQTKDNAV
jgi:integrase